MNLSLCCWRKEVPSQHVPGDRCLSASNPPYPNPVVLLLLLLQLLLLKSVSSFTFCHLLTCYFFVVFCFLFFRVCVSFFPCCGDDSSSSSSSCAPGCGVGACGAVKVVPRASLTASTVKGPPHDLIPCDIVQVLLSLPMGHDVL